MLETVRELLTRQFEAAIATVGLCVEACPEALWDAPVANLTFNQVAFHALFFADYYLGRDKHVGEQAFHRDHPEIFRDYEELLPRKQTLSYDRPGLQAYLNHCRQKAIDSITSETAESLAGPNGVSGRSISRAELHVYSIRHIQHHAAQLSLRLRLDAGVEIPWVGSGWSE
jgi:hypothetical protein